MYFSTSEMSKYFDLKDMGILLDNLAKEFSKFLMFCSYNDNDLIHTLYGKIFVSIKHFCYFNSIV